MPYRHQNYHEMNCEVARCLGYTIIPNILEPPNNDKHYLVEWQVPNYCTDYNESHGTLLEHILIVSRKAMYLTGETLQDKFCDAIYKALPIRSSVSTTWQVVSMKPDKVVRAFLRAMDRYQERWDMELT